MASLNKVFLMGNLTRDPELRYTSGGSAVCNMGLAVSRRYTTAGGEQREDVCPLQLQEFGQPFPGMLGALAAESIVFRWTSSEDPSFINEPGFQQGVVWDMPKEDAWRNARSWQHFIRQSDIGIVPVAESIKSAHKILNYMAYGIPVVCSPTPAHRQIVEHGVNGFFASETSEWLHYIRLLKNPESRREMGRRAKASVLERYSVAVLADQYAEVLMRHYRAGSSLAYAEMKF